MLRLQTFFQKAPGCLLASELKVRVVPLEGLEHLCHELVVVVVGQAEANGPPRQDLQVPDHAGGGQREGQVRHAGCTLIGQPD